MAYLGLCLTIVNRNCSTVFCRKLSQFVVRLGRNHSIVSSDRHLRYCHWKGLPSVTTRFRGFSTTAKPALQKETVTIHFKFPDGTSKSAQAELGTNLLDTVISNNLDIDGYGACEGTLACSTCHLIFNPSDYAKLPQKPTDEELDMLDLAYGLVDTSRLGCQVTVTKDMDGWEVLVPGGIADARG